MVLNQYTTLQKILLRDDETNTFRQEGYLLCGINEEYDILLCENRFNNLIYGKDYIFDKQKYLLKDLNELCYRCEDLFISIDDICRDGLILTSLAKNEKCGLLIIKDDLSVTWKGNN